MTHIVVECTCCNSELSPISTSPCHQCWSLFVWPCADMCGFCCGGCLPPCLRQKNQQRNRPIEALLAPLGAELPALLFCRPEAEQVPIPRMLWPRPYQVPRPALMDPPAQEWIPLPFWQPRIVRLEPPTPKPRTVWLNRW